MVHARREDGRSAGAAATVGGAGVYCDGPEWRHRWSMMIGRDTRVESARWAVGERVDDQWVGGRSLSGSASFDRSIASAADDAALVEALYRHP